MFGVDTAAGSNQNDAALDQVLQLAHIAGASRDPAAAARRPILPVRSLFGGEAAYQVARQRLDILGALAAIGMRIG